MKTLRIVSVTLCIVAGFVLIAFAGKPPAVPDPTGLVVTNTTSSSISISWSSGGGTTVGFVVAYLEGTTYPAEKCTTGTQVDVGTNTIYVLNNLPADTTFSFRVCAYDRKNKRSKGITVQGTTLGAGPAEPGITWDPDEVATSESDQTDTISVVLDSQPTSDVVILVDSRNHAEAIVSPEILTFTAQNWDQSQTVVVTGVDDNVVDGSVDYFIDMMVDPLATADLDYANLDPISIGRNADNDGVETAFSNDTPLAIRDYRRNQTPTISHVDFPYSDAWKKYVKTIQVDVSITHGDMSQLSVWLVSPLNTECQLQYDGVKWVLTDPDIFRGEDIAGAWTLEVTDNVRRTVGTLDGWSITVTPRNRSYVFKVEDGLTFRVEVHRYGTDVGPGIYLAHGGGFIFGNRFLIAERVTEDLLDENYIIMSVDYRLAPESKMDAAWDDISDGYQWVQTHGPDLFQLDPNRVAVYGESAGAFYAQLGGYRLTPRPKAVVSFYGGNNFLSPWTMEPAHTGAVIDEEEALVAIGDEPLVDGACDPPRPRQPYCTLCRQQAVLPFVVTGWEPEGNEDIYDALYCPLLNVDPFYPPTILVHATGDADVPVVQSYNMQGALAVAGVPWDMVIVEADTHVLYGGADPADVDAAYQRVISFLDTHVKQAP